MYVNIKELITTALLNLTILGIAIMLGPWQNFKLHFYQRVVRMIVQLGPAAGMPK